MDKLNKVEELRMKLPRIYGKYFTKELSQSKLNEFRDEEYNIQNELTVEGLTYEENETLIKKLDNIRFSIDMLVYLRDYQGDLDLKIQVLLDDIFDEDFG